MNKEVRVGATTIILRDGKIMLGESIEECAKCEAFEETGLVVDSI